MARKKSELNKAPKEVIEQEFLKELPQEDISTKVVVAPYVPEMRKVMFLNGRDPGYPLDFHYASKTHPLKIYKLFHGKEHLLPVEVIDHLESCAERQYGYRPGMDGHPEMYVKGLRYLFQCKPVRAA